MGEGVHLLGGRMCSRLTLDYQKACFVYHDPVKNVKVEFDGIIQVRIGVDRGCHQVNKLPFLPIRWEGKTFRGTCPKCLKDKNAQLCHRDMSQRLWQETYSGGRKLVSSLVERKDVSLILTIFPKNFWSK